MARDTKRVWPRSTNSHNQPRTEKQAKAVKDKADAMKRMQSSRFR